MHTTTKSKDTKSIFRYKEDRWPVIIILMLTIADFIMYFYTDNFALFAIYYFLMMLPKTAICAWNHHHQHIFTFRNNLLNRLLELAYALHTGVTTNLWRLHHVLGHHLNFLDQKKDESRWMRKNGKKMGVIEYTLDVALSAYPRGYKVGKKYPKQLKPFLIFSLISLLVVIELVWYKPMAGIMIFVLPMATSLLLTAYVTYEHHSGLDTQNEFEASYNNLNPVYNRLTGNLGYHTAHHHKQGLHWSKLPDLHAKISQHIPDNLYRKSIITRLILGG